MHAPAQPASLGPYRILRTIGRGGMAEIFLALAQGPGGFTKLAVIKRIWPELASDPDFIAMFNDEARLSARLSHPNIVQTFELGMQDGRPFLAMEFLDGQSFAQVQNRLRAPGALPFPLRLRVLADVLAALDYAHELRDFDGRPLGVVHRDVSPHNVFVTYTGNTKLIDFGIAKTLAASHHTRPGVLKGRLAYMSPEQLRNGGQTVDRRADLFTVGIMLWEAIAGQRMWRGKTEPDIARALVVGDGVPAPVYNPDVPDEVYAVCERALSVDPDARYQTAAEFQLALERLIGATPESRSRELARVVCHAFELERARTNALVDKAMRAATPDAANAEPWINAARATGSFEVPAVPATLETPAPVPVGKRRGFGTTIRIAASAAAITGALWLVRPAAEVPPPPASTASTVRVEREASSPSAAVVAEPATVAPTTIAHTTELERAPRRRVRKLRRGKEPGQPPAGSNPTSVAVDELRPQRPSRRTIDIDDPYEVRPR